MQQMLAFFCVAAVVSATAKELADIGLLAAHTIVIIDQQQGGQATVEAVGCSLHSILINPSRTIFDLGSCFNPLARRLYAI